MKLSRHPSLTWTLSSTLVLALTFGLTMFSGSAAAPGSNPPNGNIVPTFNSLITTSDITAGGTLFVGTDIQPKTGTGLTLGADKVNFTKDIEAKGAGKVTGLLTADGGVKTDSITSTTPNDLLLNFLKITKPIVATKPVSISAYYGAAPTLAPDSIAFGFGSAGILIKKGPNGTGKLTADGDIETGNQFIGKGASIGGILTDGLSPTGSVDPKYQLALVDGNTTVNSSQFTLGAGTEFNSDFLNTYSNPTKSLFTGTVGVGGHLSAGSIGDFALHTFANGNGGNKVTVSPGNKGIASTLNCPATQVMLSCSLFSSQATLTPSVMMEIIYVAGKPIWKCGVDAYNAGASDADYYGSAVCFDPNG